MFSSRILKRKAFACGASELATAPMAFSSVAVLALALGPGAAAAQQASEKQDQPVELEEVVVTGSQITLPEAYTGGQVARGGRAGILGNLDMMDTPFASTNYTADLILNQQARGIADVLANDPNVRPARGFGNFQEVFLIRGFPAFSDDMTYNGIYGILPRQYVAAEFMERVELFRGASAFLNGAAPGGSNLGGTVNLVPKRAPDEALTRLTVGYENAAAGYGALDVGRRFGADGATGVRANAVYRDGETSVEDQDRKLTVLSFGVDHRGEDLRLSADIGYQDHHIDAPRPSVTPWGEIPKPPDADGNFAQRWTYTDEEQFFGVVRAEYDVSDSTSVWGAFGLRNGKEKNVLTLPGALEDGTTFSYRFDNAREDDVLSGELGLRTDFDTGSVGHRIIVSASTFSLESRNAYAFSDFFNSFVDDLYDPQPVDPPPADFFVGGDMSSPHVTFTTDTTSYAIADTMSFADDAFLLTIGARQQNIQGETFDYNTGDRLSKYDESKVTPVGGIVYKPNETVSLYANYIEGLIAGDIPPTVANGLPVVNGSIAQDPYQAEQIEAGVKYDSGEYGATFSLFSVTRPFGVLEPVDDPAYPDGALVFKADGEQRNRGVELSLYGEVAAGLRLLGGLTWLDAEMTKTQDGVNQGKTAVGSPDLQANVNLEWDVPGVQGLTFDGRVIYTSSQYADAANTIEADSWMRLDIGGRYAMEFAGKPVMIRARIDNVTDESDWVSVGGYPGSNYLVLGAPRTFILSASVDF
ncbi:MAG TPA: TonB-dependent receptor [Pseudomonadales bacterium]|nr:TonB-dependent receptor [Pseudomonadales bacterium]